MAGLAQARDSHTATLLGDGRVLVVGGWAKGVWSSGPLSSAELYDPVSQQWSVGASLAQARDSHTATLLGDGKVLVAGGTGVSFEFLRSAERHDPGSAHWSAVAGLAQNRADHMATLMGDGKVLVAGGSFPACHSVELYDPDSSQWRAGASLGAPRERGHTVTLLGDGKVLVAGGWGLQMRLNGTAVYDPVSGQWSTGAWLAQARAGHTATLLADGKVLVAGGNAGNKAGFRLKSAELYDPVTEQWSAVGNLAHARTGHTATLLDDGKVLVAGGWDDEGLSSAELYDPVSGQWSAVASLTHARAGHTVTLLADGKVLVTGGIGAYNQPLSSTELYDPASGRWSAVESLTPARHSHTATLLSDGKVLVVGGRSNRAVISSAELYDPVSGQWSAVESLAQPRYSHTATLLGDGKVLVVGGHRDGGQALVTELGDFTGQPPESENNLAVRPISELEINFQNGQIEQLLEVTNAGGPVPGFEIAIDGLPADVVVSNATGSSAAGLPKISYLYALGGSSKLQLVARYFRPDLGTAFTATYSVAPSDGVMPPSFPADSEPFAILRSAMNSDGSVVIEWNSTPGVDYVVEYSGDLVNFIPIFPAVTATANRTLFVDSGPPATAQAPQSVEDRYYRVRRGTTPSSRK